MFRSTKPHEKELAEGQPRIRLGYRAPSDAVTLAYTYSPPLTPKENVQIADFSGFILENMTDQGVIDMELWPNDQGLLTTWDGDGYIYAQNFLLTNQFLNDTPLYYVHELTYPIYDTKGSRGLSSRVIQIVDAKGDLLPASYLYKCVLIPTDNKHIYKVRIFTNFETQPNEIIRVVYTAYKEGRVLPGYSEQLQPHPAFERSQDIEEVVLMPNENNLLYYQTHGKDVGQSQIYVGAVPMEDSDYRVPVPFRYRITATATLHGNTYQIVTPWFYDSVFNRHTLSSADEDMYVNGHKRLGGKIAMEIVKEFGDITPFQDPEAEVFFSVESSKKEVTVYTQPDGKNYVLAYTDEPTNPIYLPDTYRKQYRAKDYPFTVVVQIDGGEYQYIRGTVNILEGHKLIAGPFQGNTINIALVRPYDPVNIYIKDNYLYAYTTETEVYYVPKFSLRTSNSRQIRVLPPAEKYPTENWYIRVKNGQFTRQATTPAGFNIKYFYNIPEYFKQDFDTEYGLPIRKVLEERPEIIGDHKIRVRYTPLYIRQDKKNKAYNIEIFVNGLPASIRAWDASDGTIEVDMKIRETDSILVNYYYEELAFTYRGYWDEKNQQFWHLDLNPSVGHTYTDYDKDTEEIVERPTFQLINKTIYLYMRPTAKFTENGELVRGSYRSHVLFHTFEEINEPNVLLLAKIQVRPNSSLDDIQIIDVRKRGGGLKESIHPEVMKVVEPESEFYWDIGYWDGEPYPENGVIVVRLPKYILKEQGGRFTKEEVEKIVKRHIGYGNLPIIEYVDEPQELLPTPWNIQAELIDKE